MGGIENGFANKDFVGVRRDPVAVLVLSFITCGIYGIYWLYKVGEEVNAVLGREAVKPWLGIIGLVFAPIYLVYLYMLDQVLPEVSAARGVTPWRGNFVLWLVLTLVCGIGMWFAYYQIQSFLNSVWEKTAAGGTDN